MAFYTWVLLNLLPIVIALKSGVSATSMAIRLN